MARMTNTSFMTGIKNWVLGKIANIMALIPNQASSSNQLADKNFVNSSIATATATFRGTYNVVSDLSLSYNATHAQIEAALVMKMAALSIVVDNNDYAFVQIPTADATPTEIAKIEKYKYNGTAWAFEYELNNSGFTAAQWAAINSGATLELIGKLSALPTNSELTTILNGKASKAENATAGHFASLDANGNPTDSGISLEDNGAYDVTAHNSGAKFADLSALLSNVNLNTLIPVAVRKGGMSIKFVQSSDNKYVQYRLMSDSFSTTESDWQGVDNEPTAGSENLVKSSGIAKLVGIKNTVQVVGNGSSFATLPASKYVLVRKGIPYIVRVHSSKAVVVPDNVSEGKVTFVVLIARNSSVIGRYGEKTAPEHINNGDVINIPAQSEDSYLGFEGRWNSDTSLYLEVCEDIAEDVVLSTNELLADNKNKKLVVPPFRYVVGDNVTAVSQKEIPYTNFDRVNYLTHVLYYNKETNEASVKPVASSNGSDTILGVVVFDDSRGNIASIQSSVFNTKISDGIDFHRGDARVLHTSSINFDNANHKVVISGLIISNPTSKQRLTIPATEVPYNFSQLNSTAYWFVYNITESAYKFVLAGNNSNEDIVIAGLYILGNSSATPNSSRVSNIYWCTIRDSFIDGVNVYTRLSEVENKLSARPIDTYEDKNLFVDGDTWKTAYGYKCKVIPVNGGGKITCVANSSIPTRIAFLNSFDEAYITANVPVAVDGTGNMNTAAGQTRIYDIPATCTYIALNSLYGNSNSLPVSLVIDGKEYMGNIFNRLDCVEKISGEVKNDTDVIDKILEKDYTTAEFSVAKGTIWGAGYIDPETSNNLYSKDFISVVGGTPVSGICAENVTIRIVEYDEDKKYIKGASNAYAKIPILTLDLKTKFVRISASYSNHSSSNPITPEDFTVGDFGIYYHKSNVYTEIVDLVNNVQKGVLTSVIGRNTHKDAAVRATGQKAVDSDIKPLSLIHISDIHTKDDNYKCFENACEYLQYYSNIKCMIATGDLVWDNFTNLTTWYDIALQKTTKPVLNVIGNHDAGQQSTQSPSLDRVSTDLQCYNRYIAPYVSAGTLPNGVTVPGWNVIQPVDAATEGKSYYYKDFTDEKIRLIVLCEFETEYELSETSPTTSLKYSREYRAMRQTQVTWLINTLTNTPNDYGVVIAMHQIPDLLGNENNEFVSFDLVDNNYSYNVYSSDKAWLAKIINAYATRSSLTLTVTQTGAVVQNDAILNCDCDFTSVQSEFICVICGHTHRDYVGHLKNYPTISVLCVGADNLKYTSAFQPRAENTISEDLFNVVNIDRNRKTIKIIRIGSDASVTGQVRDQMIMSYATT